MLYWGATLDLLPKYAFAVPPTDTDIAIPHYPGLARTATNNHDNQAYFNIGQFGNIRIEQVSDSNGNIPQGAFTTKSNVFLERLLLQQVVPEVSIRLVTHLLDLIIQLIHLMKMLVVEIQSKLVVQY